jgi:hypothetical protein
MGSGYLSAKKPMSQRLEASETVAICFHSIGRATPLKFGAVWLPC